MEHYGGEGIINKISAPVITGETSCGYLSLPSFLLVHVDRPIVRGVEKDGDSGEIGRLIGGVRMDHGPRRAGRWRLGILTGSIWGMVMETGMEKLGHVLWAKKLDRARTDPNTT